MTPADNIRKRLLQVLSNRSANSGTDLPEIDFAQTNDLRRSAANKHLVDDIQLVAGDWLPSTA